MTRGKCHIVQKNMDTKFRPRGWKNRNFRNLTLHAVKLFARKVHTSVERVAGDSTLSLVKPGKWIEATVKRPVRELYRGDWYDRALVHRFWFVWHTSFTASSILELSINAINKRRWRKQRATALLKFAWYFYRGRRARTRAHGHAAIFLKSLLYTSTIESVVNFTIVQSKYK